MLRKTLAISLASTALVLGSTGLAFAYDYHRGGRGGMDVGSSFEISVENDQTSVQNYAYASSDTGNNDQDVDRSRHSYSRRSGGSATQSMTTGDAGSDALADATVNDTYINSDCGCLDGEEGRRRMSMESSIDVENEDTYLMNGAEAEAETGDNDQDADMPRRRGTTSQSMRTGSATSVSTAMARVNMSELRVNR